MLAEIDYVTDPEDRSMRFHYERADRDYHKIITFDTFQRWGTEGSWTAKREQYYEEIKRRIVIQRLDQLVEQRFREIEEITEDLQFIHEWIKPLRDENGEVKRYPVIDDETGMPHRLAGLPVYAVPFSSMESAIKTWIQLDQHLMLKRGEATTRSETTTEQSGQRPNLLDPKNVMTTVTKDDIRKMAQALVQHRQPELLQQPVIDIQPETGVGDDDDGNTI